jgi:hypothetical protein
MIIGSKDGGWEQQAAGRVHVVDCRGVERQDTHGHLMHYEAWTALTTQVMKTLLYVVPVMNLMKQQNDCIMAPILMSSLNAMGMQKYMP